MLQEVILKHLKTIDVGKSCLEIWMILIKVISKHEATNNHQSNVIYDKTYL